MKTYNVTELRAVLYALLDLEANAGLVLTKWQHDLCGLLVTQGHYSTRETIAIIRLLNEHVQSGELAAAQESRNNANSETNREKTLAHIRQRKPRRNQRDTISCPVCQVFGALHFHVDGKDVVTAICKHRQCVRLISEPDKVKRKPRFGNIIPHDIGTFLVESEHMYGVFYLVDVIEQSCTCPDYRFRHAEGKCKHLLETNYAVYDAKAF